MRRLCPARLRTMLVAVIMTSFVSGCGILESSPSPTATPTTAQSLGLEIAETYGQLMLHARLIVDARPAAAEAKERLRVLHEEYKLQFGNYACLRDTLSDADQADVAAAFDANRDAFLPEDMSWFEDASSDYDIEDPAIRERLEDIETLDDYAFLERATESRPGEELLCGS